MAVPNAMSDNSSILFYRSTVAYCKELFEAVLYVAAFLLFIEAAIRRTWVSSFALWSPPSSLSG
jgi:hypothetical protein